MSYEMDRLRRRIREWQDAYPSDIFPEPDLKKVHEVLAAAGMSVDRISAHVMRFALARVQRLINDADNETDE